MEKDHESEGGAPEESGTRFNIVLLHWSGLQNVDVSEQTSLAKLKICIICLVLNILYHCYIHISSVENTLLGLICTYRLNDMSGGHQKFFIRRQRKKMLTGCCDSHFTYTQHQIAIFYLDVLPTPDCKTYLILRLVLPQFDSSLCEVPVLPQH